MIFRVEHLGPLREAEVDLSKNLIVLAGPNSSGKTYLAWSVYGLWRYGPIRGGDQLKGYVASKLASGIQEFELEALTRQCVEELTSSYSQRLHRAFAAEPGYFERSKIGLHVPRVLDIPSLDQERFVARNREFRVFAKRTDDKVRFQFDRQTVEESSDKDETLQEEVALASLSEEEKEGLAHLINTMVMVSAARKLFAADCVIFPAERIATSVFAKELSLKRTQLVDQLLDMQAQTGRSSDDAMQLVREQAQRYPWPIRDSLQIANDLDRLSKQTSPFADLAEALERSIMGGTMGLSEYGQPTFTPAEAPDMALGIHHSASVVKSLSSLVFYFRHQAKEGDFIIIDEPELNLHPDNQRRVARVLAQAANRGIKIMMSSHSDYLMRELNNLIMLSQPTEAAAELRRRLGYDEASVLTPDKVGVYLFQGGTAAEVPVDETGFAIDTIEAEINRLNEESQEIYATLFDD